MPKQGKSPKKKTKEKSPQRTEESEYPEMDQDVYNRLLQNAIEQSKAELQRRHEEQLKAVEERLTRKFDDEVRELSRAFDESRGANPTTRDATWMRDIMTEAVVAANRDNANLTTQKPYIPNRFLDALEEQKYNPYIRGDAQLKLLFISLKCKLDPICG
jgi:cation transport regulator ChaB